MQHVERLFNVLRVEKPTKNVKMLTKKKTKIEHYLFIKTDLVILSWNNHSSFARNITSTILQTLIVRSTMLAQKITV